MGCCLCQNYVEVHYLYIMYVIYRIDYCIAGCMTCYLPRGKIISRRNQGSTGGEARGTSEASKGDNFSKVDNWSYTTPKSF